jgi:hypothetical protein
MWKQGVRPNLKYYSHHFPEGTEESHIISRQLIPRPRFERGTSRLRSRSAKHFTATLGTPLLFASVLILIINVVTRI